jgi:NADP-dependent 3-hydroxy acid dehydrogenase YdfG
LAQDVRVKKIQEQRQQRRHELEMEQQRRQRKEQEKRLRKELRVATSAIEADGEWPHHTTASTLLCDFLVFHLLLLFALPRRAVLYLWSRAFSKKWTTRRKNVLLTGVNSALGSETARQFAAEGANLILLSHSTTSSEKGLDWLVEECQELGSGKIRSYSADLSNAISTELTLRQAAKDFDDTFDVVVLNGENKSHGCLFEEIVDVHQIEKMVTENTLGCMMSLHYSMKHIPKTSDSRIVILSSTSGMVASPYRSVYGATQHALKGFCDSIRMELNDTYTERKAPKICFASFPELVGQNIHNRDNFDSRMSRMGADVAPMKSRSWAGIPLQQAVHGLVEAISSGERDFGAPKYVNAWRFIQVLAPSLVDFSIFRHFRKTQYRPVEGDRDASIGKKGGKGDGASVSNKTWSQ